MVAGSVNPVPTPSCPNAPADEVLFSGSVRVLFQRHAKWPVVRAVFEAEIDLPVGGGKSRCRLFGDYAATNLEAVAKLPTMSIADNFVALAEAVQARLLADAAALASPAQAPAPKAKRGRPAGSKNQSKPTAEPQPANPQPAGPAPVETAPVETAPVETAPTT